ncbi:hypothetical protein PACTADRAFT_34115 [Pachysolen tannophilus NRRL Y-2460]|uniref:Uncharacterized protein n=1 Tax=Pachysolen tannophilus NRRL Y-2460 TaxID=669874 RepID=A0A1E4TUX3_PACTA|nr:hypothetical protein PACTADRAFT_34115 [Pachysolen tannophilus NRRL Y-2460]
MSTNTSNTGNSVNNNDLNVDDKLYYDGNNAYIGLNEDHNIITPALYNESPVDNLQVNHNNNNSNTTTTTTNNNNNNNNELAYFQPAPAQTDSNSLTQLSNSVLPENINFSNALIKNGDTDINSSNNQFPFSSVINNPKPMHLKKQKPKKIQQDQNLVALL